MIRRYQRHCGVSGSGRASPAGANHGSRSAAETACRTAGHPLYGEATRPPRARFERRAHRLVVAVGEACLAPAPVNVHDAQERTRAVGEIDRSREGDVVVTPLDRDFSMIGEARFGPEGDLVDVRTDARATPTSVLLLHPDVLDDELHRAVGLRYGVLPLHVLHLRLIGGTSQESLPKE